MSASTPFASKESANLSVSPRSVGSANLCQPSGRPAFLFFPLATWVSGQVLEEKDTRDHGQETMTMTTLT